MIISMKMIMKNKIWYNFIFCSIIEWNKVIVWGQKKLKLLINFNDPNELPKEMEFYTYEEFKKFISVEDDIKWICLFKILY